MSFSSLFVSWLCSSFFLHLLFTFLRFSLFLVLLLFSSSCVCVLNKEERSVGDRSARLSLSLCNHFTGNRRRVHNQSILSRTHTAAHFVFTQNSLLHTHTQSLTFVLNSLFTSHSELATFWFLLPSVPLEASVTNRTLEFLAGKKNASRAAMETPGLSVPHDL